MLANNGHIIFFHCRSSKVHYTNNKSYELYQLMLLEIASFQSKRSQFLLWFHNNFWNVLLNSFKIDYFFQGSFHFTAKLNRKYRDFPYVPCPDTRMTSLLIHIPHQSGTFFTVDELALTHQYNPKSVVYIYIMQKFQLYLGGIGKIV